MVDETEAAPDDPAGRGAHGELQRLSYQNPGESPPLPSLRSCGPSEGLSVGPLSAFFIAIFPAPFGFDRLGDRIGETAVV
ncbi:MAG: hypothetical protein CBC48_00240 [bacterium TMED88]|nr:hypothetical protein [Deltaproteobacteria bacterium]OUV37613.1 MAG: hypothetical protein CBC48_00240 [bacterium TMED88]